jgi:hypothetical protein
MKTHATFRWASAFLVVVPVLFLVLFTLLSVVFDYPAILRQPTADILVKFAAGGPGLLTLWYGMAASAFLLIPTSLLISGALRERGLASTGVVVFGVLAAAFQTLGFLRWSFLVPWLSSTFADPSASVVTREVAVALFGAFHQFFGAGVGEHLGYAATTVWTLLLIRGLTRAGVLNKLWSTVGVVLALGIAVGMAEPAGLPGAGAVNAIAYSLWGLWLPAVGVLWWLRGTRIAPPPATP